MVSDFIINRGKVIKDTNFYKKGDWVFGYYAYLEKLGACIIPMVELDGRKQEPIQVEKNTVGLRSGWFDKNKKFIHTGDIIQLKNENGQFIQVICKFGIAERDIYGNKVEIIGFYFEREDGKKTFPIIDNYAGRHDTELFEIIGDIYI